MLYLAHTRIAITDRWFAEFWDCFFGGDFDKNGKAKFISYYDEVRSYVPKERLLEYRMGDGWGPLCEFLEVPVPEGKKFPRTNDTDGFVSRCRGRNRAQMYNVAFRAVIYGGTIAATGLGALAIFKRYTGGRMPWSSSSS